MLCDKFCYIIGHRLEMQNHGNESLRKKKKAIVSLVKGYEGAYAFYFTPSDKRTCKLLNNSLFFTYAFSICNLCDWSLWRDSYGRR